MKKYYLATFFLLILSSTMNSQNGIGTVFNNGITYEIAYSYSFKQNLECSTYKDKIQYSWSSVTGNIKSVYRYKNGKKEYTDFHGKIQISIHPTAPILPGVELIVHTGYPSFYVNGGDCINNQSEELRKLRDWGRIISESIFLKKVIDEPHWPSDDISQEASDIKIVVNSDNDSNGNVRGNGKTNNSKKTEKKVEEKKISELATKIQNNINVENDVKKAEQAGNYVRAAQIKNANTHLYSKEERKISSYGALAQVGTSLLVKAFEVNPANQARREKERKEREDNKKSTLQEAITSDFNPNGLAVKRNKKGWYGFVDKSNNWVIKPKYLFAEPFIEGKAKVETKTGKIIFINKNGDKI